MTRSQIAYIKSLSQGRYGAILDACIDGSVALRGDEADLARMILNVIENNGGRYADRIGTRRVTEMAEWLLAQPKEA